MAYSTEHLLTILRNAREAKGLSQRALSELAGVPQSHISKIESGGVDLRVSSLVELARALDLELALVPRKSVPAVQSVVRSTTSQPRHGQNVSPREMQRLQAGIEAVHKAFPAATETAQIQRQFRDLQHLPIGKENLKALREISKRLEFIQETDSPEALRQPLRQLQDLRATLVHDLATAAPAERARPAYSLEEDDDGE